MANSRSRRTQSRAPTASKPTPGFLLPSTCRLLAGWPSRCRSPSLFRCPGPQPPPPRPPNCLPSSALSLLSPVRRPRRLHSFGPSWSSPVSPMLVLVPSCGGVQNSPLRPFESLVHIKILEEICLLLRRLFDLSTLSSVVDDAMVALIDTAGDRLIMDIRVSCSSDQRSR
jgi:hypothetical protein